MMKRKMLIGMFIILGINAAMFTSCKKDKEEKDTTPVLRASFDYKGNYRPTPGSVVFTNTSVSAVSYQWEFGDGATSEEANPVHKYTAAGKYEVVLIATDSDGMTSTSKRTLTMLGACNSVSLEDFFIYKEAVTTGNGSEWDADGSGPDIYFRIYDANNAEVFNLGSCYTDFLFDDTLHNAVSFSHNDFQNLPFVITSVNSNYTIKVFDYDPENSNNSELICEATFKAADYMPKDTLESYSSIFSITTPKINMNISWGE